MEEIRKNPLHSQLHTEVENKLLAEKVKNYMIKYHPKKWEIMQLKDLQGLTYEEIAELLNENENTLKVRHHRAKEVALEYLNRKTSLDRFKSGDKNSGDSQVQ